MRTRALMISVAVLAGLAATGAGRPIVKSATFTVNSTADDDDGTCQQPPAGDCTLREAINASNAATQGLLPNTIKFSVGTGVALIPIATSLPAVTRRVTIDGTTQPGPTTASCFTELGHPCVELRGPASNSGVFGLTLNVGATVKALAVNGFTEGIYIEGAGNDVVEDSYVGTAADGTVNGVGGNFVGVRLRPTTAGNQVGLPGHGNLLSNNSGAAVGTQPASAAQCYGTAPNVIQSNRIGTNAAGTAALPNTATGITIFDMTNVTVGGTAAGTGNVISGNAYQGVSVFEGSVNGCGAVPSANVTIEGNLIGTNAAGTAAIPNGTASNPLLDPSGVRIEATGVTVGGSTSTARNVLSGNGGPAIQFGSNSTGDASGSSNTVQGNFIGTNADGTAAVGNPTGVLIEGPSAANTIGGPFQGSPEGSAGNLISGNGAGIRVLGGSASTNLIRGNFVGTNALGDSAIPNVTGIVVDGAPSTTIDQNVIAGNDPGTGVRIAPGSTDTTVTGNFIGTEADGATALPNDIGVLVSHAGTVRIGGAADADSNVISGNASEGVLLDVTNGAIVQGNRIGVDAAGSAAVPNGGPGLEVVQSTGTILGGTVPGAGNVVSGNGGDGIELSGGSGSVIRRNRIGTNAAGSSAVPNGANGIEVAGSSGNRIGGATAGARNVISGNAFSGVFVHDPAATTNRITGNLIGTDSSGTAGIGNGRAGVLVLDASHAVIGGTTTAAGNRIAFNTGRGVMIDDPGAAAVGDAIHRNAIFRNGKLGIDLGGDGRDTNDAHDGDGGPNRHQNFPVIHSARNLGGGGTTVRLSLSSAPKTRFVVELFSSVACDPSGFGEGQAFVMSKPVTTDANGTVSVTFVRSPAIPKGQLLTATATDPAGNTSEFSRCTRVTA
jgi:CSLREA domain-containing protein